MLQESESHFDKLGAKQETFAHVEFLESDISLDIDFDKGATVGKWKLEPDTPPTVRIPIEQSVIIVCLGF